MTMNQLSEEELSRLAEQAILQDAKRGALRAEMAGPSGWLKPKLLTTNKRFLKNTIKGALAANEAQDKRVQRIKGTKLECYERLLKEQKRYKRVYIQASTKSKILKSLGSNVNKDTIDRCKTNDECKDNTLESKSNMESFVNAISWEHEGPLEVSNTTISYKSKINNKRKKEINEKRSLQRNIAFVKESKTAQLHL